MGTLLEKLRQQLLALQTLLTMDRQCKLLYDAAYSFLGEDASPQDNAPDEFGCVDSLVGVLDKAFPALHIPSLISTITLARYLEDSPHFMELPGPEAGCIILAETNTGNGKVSNGHVGICGKRLSEDGSLWVMSNDSRNGLWSVNFTVKGWERYYERLGGMKTRYFKPV